MSDGLRLCGYSRRGEKKTAKSGEYRMLVTLILQMSHWQMPSLRP